MAGNLCGHTTYRSLCIANQRTDPYVLLPGHTTCDPFVLRINVRIPMYCGRRTTAEALGRNPPWGRIPEGSSVQWHERLTGCSLVGDTELPRVLLPRYACLCLATHACSSLRMLVPHKACLSYLQTLYLLRRCPGIFSTSDVAREYLGDCSSAAVNRDPYVDSQYIEICMLFPGHLFKR